MNSIYGLSSWIFLRVMFVKHFFWTLTCSCNPWITLLKKELLQILWNNKDCFVTVFCFYNLIFEMEQMSEFDTYINIILTRHVLYLELTRKKDIQWVCLFYWWITVKHMEWCIINNSDASKTIFNVAFDTFYYLVKLIYDLLNVSNSHFLSSFFWVSSNLHFQHTIIW